MFAGHSLETLWIVMHEALRGRDRARFKTTMTRIRRLIEMCWDYVFDGWAGEDNFVFSTPKHCQGPNYNMKTMWAQCEILVACMTVLEYTGQSWAKEWYDRARAFALKTMPSPRTACGDRRLTGRARTSNASAIARNVRTTSIRCEC